MQNNVDDLPRELLKDKPGLQHFSRPMPAARQIMSPHCSQAVSSADPPTDRCLEALSGADHCAPPVDVRACAGGGSCSESFVDATIFAPDRTPSMCRPPRCPGAAQERRSGFAGSASTWLAVPRAHELVCLRQQRLHSRTSRCVLQRLRRAAPGCVACILLVSRFVYVARAHVERCREQPRSGSLARCSGTACQDFFWSWRYFY